MSEAVERVSSWVEKYRENGYSVWGDKTGVSYESAPLLLSDIEEILKQARHD